MTSTKTKIYLNEEEVDPLHRLALQDFSYSRINTWETCNLRYFYHYICKYPESTHPAALLGNVIHKALEVTVEDDMPLSKVELIMNYRNAVPEFDPDGDLISHDLLKQGEDMLLEYVDVHPGVQKITDKELAFIMIIGLARISGYIDAVIVEEDRVKIVDYKSGKKKVAKKNVATNLQMGIYAIALKELYPDKEIECCLYYLRDQSVRSHIYTDKEIEDLQVEILNKTKAIIQMDDFLPTSNEYDCRFCSYAIDKTCSTGASRRKRRRWD